ncbi:hypothetical protein DOTSEDRAFT_75256 [Dothistroma septosporum NZE10]|uniref:Uncharacterized protein n=1 Tax=Dothistroma septosporum (strain NZE10 / CBS 128990) TaxID=675120 RepID=M2Y2K8_DOTSN|nr:hypothetical protein DOTSEDRAFT_75256 [Dothistroma septosporum NZE10]
MSIRPFHHSLQAGLAQGQIAILITATLKTGSARAAVANSASQHSRTPSTIAGIERDAVVRLSVWRELDCVPDQITKSRRPRRRPLGAALCFMVVIVRGRECRSYRQCRWSGKSN